MDNNINVNTTLETDIRSPLKELHIVNNKPAEICDNQNKNVNLFDMDSSFINKSVLIPAELDPNQNSFDPNIVQHNEEVKSDSINGNTNVLKSDSENSQNTISNNEKLRVEDFIEKTEEKTTVNSIATEVNKSSVSDDSAQSDNSILNNTVILNKSITVENNTPNKLFSEDNRSLDVSSTSKQNNSVGEHIFIEGNCNKPLNFSATLVSSDISFSNVGDCILNKQQNSLTEDSTSLSDISNKSLNLSCNLKLSDLSLADTGDKDIVVKQNHTEDQANISRNVSSTIKSSDISLTTSDVNDLIKEQNSIIEEQTVVPDSNNSLIVTSTLKSSDLSSTNTGDRDLGEEPNTEVQISVADISNNSLNVTSTLISSNLSSVNTGDNTLVYDSNTEVQISVTDNSNNSLNVRSVSNDLSVTSPVDGKSIKEQIIKTVVDHPELKENTERGISSPVVNDSFINAFTNKCSLAVDESDEIEINEFIVHAVNESKVEKLEETVELGNKCETNLSSEQILNQHVKTAVNESELKSKTETAVILENNFDCSEISHELSVESLKIVNDLIVEQEEKKSNVQVIDSNEKPVSLDQNISVDINKSPEIDSNEKTSCEISKSNSQIKEILNETLKKDIKKEHIENNIFSFEITNQTIEVPNEINNEEIKEKCCLPLSSNSTYENKIVTDIVEELISLSTIIAEEKQMSATEPNSGLSEPTVANRLALDTNAACTNEMGEIINQNECFEKQTDITNGAIDNKESLEAKARVYKEMAEKYSIVEAECEKFKDQMADLKKELKSYKQKTIALEAEIADLKQRENELNILLEEYKPTAASEDNGKDQDDQLQRLQASEEALQNEKKELKALVKQHETHLKELQRKEEKLADDLSCKTQSEMQISRVMEEYEKSISSLISEHEKMTKERDTAQMHLANIEMAFSDVHQKYERCKAIVQGYKDNEESFKQDIAMNRETIVIQEQKYETLKAHAMAQLEKSNQELAAMKKQHDTEMTRLTAQLKRYEIKNMSLMESLQQKAKECEQLSAVCDEFIGNV